MPKADKFYEITAQQIYDLALHQSIVVSSGSMSQLSITRVPGGWIYTTIMGHGETPGVANTFVPWSTNIDYRT